MNKELRSELETQGHLLETCKDTDLVKDPKICYDRFKRNNKQQSDLTVKATE
jgi:hypothetical protein